MGNISEILLAIISTFAIVKGQLLAENYSDGPCTYPPPAANYTANLPLFATPVVYVSYYMSTSNALRYAQTFLGRPANNWTEVGQLCYNIGFISGLNEQSGYNRTKVWITEGVQNASYPLGVVTDVDTGITSPGVNSSNQGTVLDTIVWDDGVKHALAVTCINKIQQQQWILYSIGAPDQWAKDIVKQLIQNSTLNLNMRPDLAIDFTPGSDSRFPFTCTDPPGPEQYTYDALQTLGVLPKSPYLNLTFVMNLLGQLTKLGLSVLAPLIEFILPLIPDTPFSNLPLIG